tara:strand:+ start:226 stop:1056 length:831 start_codon:yes stop_codon:yes gene_type:complete
MAKKATARKVEVAPQEFKEPSKMVNTQEVKKSKWEIKNRVYILKSNYTPLTYTMASRHSQRASLLWFDEERGEQRELRYATNQNSPFIDEQKGEATLGRIVFRNGKLLVPKESQNLQKLMSLYHPALNARYYEFSKVAVAEDQLLDLELEVDAMIAARNMDIDQMEAILRVELGSEVSNMTTKEVKKDLLLFAKHNPGLLLDLANDENVMLRNFAVKATEEGHIVLSQDQRTFTWATNNKKLMTVPFDEHPYSAMAAFFKTDEGMEVYKSLEKKFS